VPFLSIINFSTTCGIGRNGASNMNMAATMRMEYGILSRKFNNCIFSHRFRKRQKNSETVSFRVLVLLWSHSFYRTMFFAFLTSCNKFCDRTVLSSSSNKFGSSRHNIDWSCPAKLRPKSPAVHIKLLSPSIQINPPAITLNTFCANISLNYHVRK